MIREIKFRAWVSEFSKDNQVMIENFCFLNKENHFMAEDLTNDRPCVGAIHSVMQFTGMKDRNGKEIYEKDLILFENNELVHVVCYYKNGFILKSIDRKCHIFNIQPSCIEVIGNLCANPELLMSCGKI